MLAFIKTINSEESQDLMAKHPNAYSLLHIIASRVDTETQLAKVYPSLLSITVAEYRTALNRLVISGLVEIVEANRGKGGNTIVRVLSDSVVDTTLKKTTFQNTQNYDSLTVTQTLPKLLTNLSQTYHKLLEQLENLVNAYEKADYEDKQNIEQTYNELFLTITQTLPKRIIEKYNRNTKEINNTVVLQTTSLNVSESIIPKKKKEKAPPIADTPPTEKSLIQKIKVFFCEEWYLKRHPEQEKYPFEDNPKMNMKKIVEIESRLRKKYEENKGRQGSDQEVFTLFVYMLKEVYNIEKDEHSKDFKWVIEFDLKMFLSQFQKIFIAAKKSYNDNKAQKQVPTVQVIDKTITGEAKRLREEHEQWLKEETAKRAATKQAGE